MLRSNSKSLGNHIVSPEEEKERLRWEGFAEKEGFKSLDMRSKLEPDVANLAAILDSKRISVGLVLQLPLTDSISSYQTAG